MFWSNRLCVLILVGDSVHTALALAFAFWPLRCRAPTPLPSPLSQTLSTIYPTQMPKPVAPRFRLRPPSMRRDPRPSSAPLHHYIHLFILRIKNVCHVHMQIRKYSCTNTSTYQKIRRSGQPGAMPGANLEPTRNGNGNATGAARMVARDQTDRD